MDPASREREKIVLSNLRLLEDLTTRAPSVNLWKPGAGAYAMLETGVEDTIAFSLDLYKTHGVLVNPGECFGLPGTLRIGLGHENREEFRRAVELTVEMLGSYAD